MGERPDLDELEPGDLVDVVNANDDTVTLAVLSGPPTMGHSMMVLWVAAVEDFEQYGSEADGVPLPLESVIGRSEADRG